MGRKKKQGLDYFPFDINLFYDIKVRKLVKRHGGNAITVYAYLLSCVYKDGYYFEWDSDLPFVCGEVTGYTEDYILDVLQCCLDVCLFDRQLYEQYGVLTSEGIQRRYRRIISQVKRKCRIDEYCLIADDDTDTDAEPDNVVSGRPKTKTSARQRGKQDRPQEQQPDGTVIDADPVDPLPPKAEPMGLDEEVKSLKEDFTWAEPVCMNFGLTLEELSARLDAFAMHCRCMDMAHSSLPEAKRHFCSWLTKQPAVKKTRSPSANQPAPSQPESDFGGADY